MSNKTALSKTTGDHRIVKASDYWQIELERRRTEEESLSLSSMALSDDEDENIGNTQTVDPVLDRKSATSSRTSIGAKAVASSEKRKSSLKPPASVSKPSPPDPSPPVIKKAVPRKSLSASASAATSTVPSSLKRFVDSREGKSSTLVPSAEVLKNSAAMANRRGSSYGGADDSFASTGGSFAAAESLWSDDVAPSPNASVVSRISTTPTTPPSKKTRSNIAKTTSTTTAKNVATSTAKPVPQTRASSSVPSAEVLKNSAAMANRRGSSYGGDDSFATSTGGSFATADSLWSEDASPSPKATSSTAGTAARPSATRNAKQAVAVPTQIRTTTSVPSAEVLKNSAAMARRRSLVRTAQHEPYAGEDSFASSVGGSMADSLWSDEVAPSPNTSILNVTTTMPPPLYAASAMPKSKSSGQNRSDTKNDRRRSSVASRAHREEDEEVDQAESNPKPVTSYAIAAAQRKRKQSLGSSYGGDDSFDSAGGSSAAGASLWSNPVEDDESTTSRAGKGVNTSTGSSVSSPPPVHSTAAQQEYESDRYRWDYGEDAGVHHDSDDDDGPGQFEGDTYGSVRTPGDTMTFQSLKSTSVSSPRDSTVPRIDSSTGIDVGTSVSTPPRKASFMMPARSRPANFSLDSSVMEGVKSIGQQKRRDGDHQTSDSTAAQYVFEELKTPTMNGRKLRKRIPRLDHYRNERVVYGFRDATSQLPSVIGIVRNTAMDVTSAGMPPQKRQKQREVDDVPMHEVLDVFDHETNSVVPRVVSIPKPSFKPLVEEDNSSLISEAFGGVTGWIKLAYNAEQKFDEDPDQSKVFFVAKGEVLLTIANTTTRIPQFGTFVVPPNNEFIISHAKTNKMPILISFVALAGTQVPSAEAEE